MARPLKSGLSYFPLNVDIDQDDKTMLIESEFGIVGFGIIVKMFCKIYANGYYYEWGEKEQLLFSNRINVDKNEVIDCINAAIKWEIFNKNIYEKYNVLTSKGIQKRFIEAVGRRKSLDIVKEYWLLDIPKSEKTEVKIINVDINEENVDINSQETAVNDDISTQSKVKKSKVNKNKENESKEDEIPYEKIKDLFHELCPSYPKVIKLSDSRKKVIKARYIEYKKDLSIFEILFVKAEESNFLKGNNKEGWKANFDWLLNSNNMLKVLEDNYCNKLNNQDYKKGVNNNEKPKYADGSIYANLEC